MTKCMNSLTTNGLIPSALGRYTVGLIPGTHVVDGLLHSNTQESSRDIIYDKALALRPLTLEHYPDLWAEASLKYSS